jgi:hypothetical protein
MKTKSLIEKQLKRKTNPDIQAISLLAGVSCNQQ